MDLKTCFPVLFITVSKISRWCPHYGFSLSTLPSRAPKPSMSRPRPQKPLRIAPPRPPRGRRDPLVTRGTALSDPAPRRPPPHPSVPTSQNLSEKERHMKNSHQPRGRAWGPPGCVRWSEGGGPGREAPHPSPARAGFSAGCPGVLTASGPGHRQGLQGSDDLGSEVPSRHSCRVLLMTRGQSWFRV